MKKLFFMSVLTVACFAVGAFEKSFSETKGGFSMEIRSPVFKNEGMIDSKYTCDGIDASPPLEWKNVPKGAKSLALICDDPDAPAGTWVHWVYYDIEPSSAGLPENVKPVDNPRNGGVQGINDFRKTGYGGPCPPSGTHRYFFKLYALDMKLDLPAGATKRKLIDAMNGHVLAEARLMGRYRRQG